jgi:hypothetical protein
MNVFLMWLIGFYPLNFFPSNVNDNMSDIIRWCPFDSLLQNWFMFDVLFIFKGPKSKFHFQISSDGFFVWIPWHSYEWKINNLPWLPCFKWQNIYIYLILTIFLCGPTPFLACWIVIAPIMILVIYHIFGEK